jgi:N6-L-threonylcarbamoyladenine synthase
VVEVLVARTLRACRDEDVRTITVTGGVACNGRLRVAFAEAAAERGFTVRFPSPRYTTDNAAMIAAAGFLYHERGRPTPLDVAADANLRL